MPWQDRAVLLKAADLLAGRGVTGSTQRPCSGRARPVTRPRSTARALIDFLRFNAKYAQQILEEQPSSNPGMWNRLDHRPLEGFVFAVTPSISRPSRCPPHRPGADGERGPLKPSNTQFTAPGLATSSSKGRLSRLINFLPGNGADVGDIAIRHPALAGLHFTGSTGVFQHLWSTIGTNIGAIAHTRESSARRAEDFILAHPSADRALAVAIARGGFEYQGQKCSAASRVYIPARCGEPCPAVRRDDQTDEDG